MSGANTSMAGGRAAPRPASVSPWVRGDRAYVPRKPDPRIRWFLDANECRPLPSVLSALSEALGSPSGGVSRYPSFDPLEERIAGLWGVDPARVVVSAGGDEAIARICAARLAPGARILMHEPAFEMFGVYSGSRGATTLALRWMDGQPFPLAETLAAVRGDEAVGIAAVVSPSNPTGGAVTLAQAMEVAEACAETGAAFLFDAAYGEFADDDPSRALIDGGLAYVVRSFSKAYGLAGLRLGYAVAPDEESASALRSGGAPYPSSALSVVAAMAALDDREGVASMVARAKAERDAIATRLRSMGAKVGPMNANFALARVRDPEGLAESLAERGIAIRKYGAKSLLSDAIRISSPCDRRGLDELLAALDGAEEYV